MNRQELLDEGRHLFDTALARGVDTGRYKLVVNPEDPSATRMVAGPNFLVTPADSWFAEQIDRRITTE